MQLSSAQAMLLSLFLVLTDGPALLGNGQVTGGGIARTIECNQNIARNLQLDDQRRRSNDVPPSRNPNASIRLLFAQGW